MSPKPPLLRNLFHIIVFFICCVIFHIITGSLAPVGRGVNAVLFIGTVGSLGVLSLSFAFVRWDRTRLGDVGAWPDGRSLHRLALGFMLGLLLVILTSVILVVFGHVRWVRTGEVNVGEMSLALMAYVALSCREELAFRGYPLRRLESVIGPWFAQLVVAVVFLIEHVAGGMAWSEAIAGAGVGALLFGMAAIATRGLAVPIGVHAAWNFGDWMRSGGGKTTGFWKAVVEDGFEAHAGVVGWVGYVSVMLLATLAFWIWYQRVNSPA